MNYENNLEDIVRKLQIKVTENTLKTAFKLHPDFPSLSALSDVLTEWKVENAAVKIFPSQLDEIDLPTIAHIEDGDDGFFVIIQDYKDNKVTYWDSARGELTETLDIFSTKWRGILLLFEKTEKSEEPDYKLLFRKEAFGIFQKYLSYFTILAVFLSAFFIANTWQDALLWVTLCAGTGISTILLLSEYGIKSPTIEKLCNLSSQTNCDTVLQSSVAKLLNHFSWSEIGFCYFLASTIFGFITISTANHSFYNILFILSSFALPYTIFSIYYQWQVVKKWCTLCLFIQLIIILEFVILFQTNPIQTPSITSILSLSLCLLLPTSLWFLVKPILEKGKTLPNIERSLMTYRYNNNLFVNHLQNQREAFVGHSQVNIGANDSPILITMVSNPFCGPCGKSHEVVEKLLENYGDNVRFEFVFTGNPASQQVIKHLLSLDKNQIHDALTDWYKIVNYETWAEKYPTQITQAAEEQAKQHQSWSNNFKITHTPTFFVDGRELALPYNIQDLKYHIKYLADKVAV